jgi:hypothetical protein
MEKDILDNLGKPKQDFPENYWKAFSAIPNSRTTLFRQFSKELDKLK